MDYVITSTIISKYMKKKNYCSFRKFKNKNSKTCDNFFVFAYKMLPSISKVHGREKFNKIILFMY